MDDFSGLVQPHIEAMRIEDIDADRDDTKRGQDLKVPEEKEEEAPAIDTNARTVETDSVPESPTSTVEAPSYTKSSTTSSSSSSFGSFTSAIPTSLDSFGSPKINYGRDNEEQKLVAVIGREFDEPTNIVAELQKLVPNNVTSGSVMKFVPYTISRSVLRKCRFGWRDLKCYDLVCLCYNASEARILLTGTDGFYTTLLTNLEALIGSNKVCFLISKYLSSSLDHSSGTGSSQYISSSSALASEQRDCVQIVSPQLHQRLFDQPALRPYLEGAQVFSWLNKPSLAHTERLLELSQAEPNPTQQQCLLL